MIRSRKSNQENMPKQFILPVLPLPEQVIFPNMTRPLLVVRERSVNALKHVIENNSEILLLTMKNVVDNPDIDDLYQIGTIGKVLQSLDPKDGSIKVFISGIVRARVLQIIQEIDFTKAIVEIPNEIIERDIETQALMNNVVSTLREYINVTKKLPPETLEDVEDALSQSDPSFLADIVGKYLAPPMFDFKIQQEILSILNVKERLTKIIEIIKYNIQIFGIEKDIDGRVQEQVSKQQKEFYLNEKIKAIQKELGKDVQGLAEIDELKKKIKDAKMTKEAEEKAFKELERLEQMPLMSAEASV
ncbi:TPA: endopeptidase La, partial [bacterium]|nr:endopeptidase La [bacterium]